MSQKSLICVETTETGLKNKMRENLRTTREKRSATDGGAETVLILELLFSNLFHLEQYVKKEAILLLSVVLLKILLNHYLSSINPKHEATAFPYQQSSFLFGE